MWTMWANPVRDLYLNASPDEWYVNAYKRDLDPVLVTVKESPDGPYKGWMEDRQDYPVMIQPTQLFGMQFPYGPEIEEKAGKGRTITLDIEPQ